EPGRATLFESRRTPTVTTLSDAWIERVRRTSGFERVAWQDRREVPVTTLDRLIARHGLPRFCKIDVEGFEAEVLRGLSQPLSALSLEYVPAAVGVALAAIARLDQLGRYRFNLTSGERMRWLWPEWRGRSEVEDWLARRRPGEPSGDVYARLEERR
ncbi:MAG TPA: FkbM family methyltransferase, partial [Geminicoccaceae bacterium]|nr:FkbM family methyltransferase [Geminicoccaceae bacterium]